MWHPGDHTCQCPKCFLIHFHLIFWIRTWRLGVSRNEQNRAFAIFICAHVVFDLFQDYLDAMVGVCYDGVEGVLYLCLFSILAACAFTVMLCAIPRAWRQIASRSVRSLLVCLPERPHSLTVHTSLCGITLCTV